LVTWPSLNWLLVGLDQAEHLIIMLYHVISYHFVVISHSGFLTASQQLPERLILSNINTFNVINSDVRP